MKRFFPILMTMLVLASCNNYSEPTTMSKWKSDGAVVKATDGSLSVNSGNKLIFAGGKDDFVNFELTGMAKTSQGSTAALLFHNNGSEGSGYEVLFHNGELDGSRKSGSLSTVRNLYFTLVDDDNWFPFTIAVKGKNISVKINDVDVVCYTEPNSPYRIDEWKNRLLGSGNFALVGRNGKVDFKDLKLTALAADAINLNDTMPPIDEQSDKIIKLQQINFPVIDYHVHPKGGLTLEMAHAMSMNYGINYGLGVNAYGPTETPGEGGFGRMYQNDAELNEFYQQLQGLPFFYCVQGEGRKWINSFSKEMLGTFQCLYTDGMTVIDQKGRTTRTYRRDEVKLDGWSKERYMDILVNQFVKILSEEPADIFANAFYLPDILSEEYDKYWTDARINRVLDVMVENDIALEINARYLVPSIHILQMAKEKGMKFTFGTNNGNADFGRLEYCMEAVEKCGITADDMWFPTMSTRMARMNNIGK